MQILLCAMAWAAESLFSYCHLLSPYLPFPCQLIDDYTMVLGERLQLSSAAVINAGPRSSSTG